MDFAALTKSLVPVAIALAVAHFVKNGAVKAAAYGVAGVIVAKNIPMLQDALA